MNVGSVNPNAYLSCPYFLPYHFKLKFSPRFQFFDKKSSWSPQERQAPRENMENKKKKQSNQSFASKQNKYKQEAELSMVHHMCLYITYLP